MSRDFHAAAIRASGDPCLIAREDARLCVPPRAARVTLYDTAIELRNGRIAARYEAGETMRQLASAYGLSVPHIREILTGRGLRQRRAHTKVTPALLKRIAALTRDPGMTIGRIAWEVGLSRSTVYRLIAEHGLPRRAVGRTLRAEQQINVGALVAQYQAGATIAELAERYGVSTATVQRRLAPLGVLRTNWETRRMRTEAAA